MTEEDISAAVWLPKVHPITSTAKYFPSDSYRTLNICHKVIDFRLQALANIDGAGIFTNCRQFVDWAKQKQLDGVVTAEASIGHWPEIQKTLKNELAKQNIGLFTARHWWDENFYPYATKGFFHLKKSIPEVLEKLSSKNAK